MAHPQLKVGFGVPPQAIRVGRMSPGERGPAWWASHASQALGKGYGGRGVDHAAVATMTSKVWRLS